MSEREYTALQNALASTRMEGFEVTEQTDQQAAGIPLPAGLLCLGKGKTEAGERPFGVLPLSKTKVG